MRTRKTHPRRCTRPHWLARSQHKFPGASGQILKARLGSPDGHRLHKVLKLYLPAKLGTVVSLIVNYFFELPAWMVNRRTSLRKPNGKQMINLQRLRNTEEGFEHHAEIGRGYIADVHGTEPQRLGGQEHLQDAVLQIAIKER